MSEDIQALETQFFPDGEQMMQDIVSRNPGFWDLHAIVSEEPALGENVGGKLNSRTVTGTSKSGARITLRDLDTEVFHRLPVPGVTSPDVVDASNGNLEDYKKGIRIEVVPPSNEEDASRSITLYVPDDPSAHPDVEPLHAVTFEEGGIAKKIVPAENPVPEDQGLFEKGLEEIKYYLGDAVVWDSPESEAITPPSSNTDPFAPGDTI